MKIGIISTVSLSTISLGVALGAALPVPSNVWAKDLNVPAPVATPHLYELRMGAYVHDLFSPERGSADLNGEFLYDVFAPDRSQFRNIWIPRLRVSGTLNLGGKTSQANTGLTWTWNATDRIFLEAGFGVAVHNGKTGAKAIPKFNALGCGWGFHEQGTIGYRLNQTWNLTFTMEHMSNAGLCKQNRGLTNRGFRLGYVF